MDIRTILSVNYADVFSVVFGSLDKFKVKKADAFNELLIFITKLVPELQKCKPSAKLRIKLSGSSCMEFFRTLSTTKEQTNIQLKFNYICALLHELGGISFEPIYNLFCAYNVTQIIDIDPNNQWVKLAVIYAVDVKGLDGNTILYNNVIHINETSRLSERTYLKYCYYIIVLLIKIRSDVQPNTWIMEFLAKSILSNNPIVLNYVAESIKTHNLSKQILDALVTYSECKEYCESKIFVKLVAKSIEDGLFNIADIEPIYDKIGTYTFDGVKRKLTKLSVGGETVKCTEILELYSDTRSNVEEKLFITDEENIVGAINDLFVDQFRTIDIIEDVVNMIAKYAKSPFTKHIHELKDLLISYQEVDLIVPQSPVLEY